MGRKGNRKGCGHPSLLPNTPDFSDSHNMEGEAFTSDSPGLFAKMQFPGLQVKTYCDG